MKIEIVLLCLCSISFDLTDSSDRIRNLSATSFHNIRKRQLPHQDGSFSASTKNRPGHHKWNKQAKISRTKQAGGSEMVASYHKGYLVKRRPRIPTNNQEASPHQAVGHPVRFQKRHLVHVPVGKSKREQIRSPSHQSRGMHAIVNRIPDFPREEAGKPFQNSIKAKPQRSSSRHQRILHSTGRNKGSNARDAQEASNKRALSDQSDFSGVKNSVVRGVKSMDLVYIVGVSFMIIAVVSTLALTIPVATYCCYGCKRPEVSRDVDEDATSSSGDDGDVSVEPTATSLVDVSPQPRRQESRTHPKKDDAYNAFVSGEIDGDGDVIGRRLKLERWMTQDYAVPKKKKIPKWQRTYNYAGLDTVPEGSGDESSPAHGHPEQLDSPPDMVHPTGPGGYRGGYRPFNVRPESSMTVGRVQAEVFARRPRQVYSKPLHHPGRHQPRRSCSMVELKTENDDSF